jgi:hypothetical protein
MMKFCAVAVLFARLPLCKSWRMWNLASRYAAAAAVPARAAVAVTVAFVSSYYQNGGGMEAYRPYLSGE